MTIREAMESYLFYQAKVRMRSPSTIKGRRIYLTRFGNYFGMDADIGSLSNVDIDRYHTDMRASTSRRGKPMSIGSVNTSIRSVKALLNHCINYHGEPILAKTFMIYELKQPETHPEIILFSDVREVVAVCKDEQDRLMIALLFEAGLRIAELCAVKLEDFRDTTLDVVGKGAKHRITFVSNELYTAITERCRSLGIERGYIFRPLMHGGDHYTNIDTVRARIKRVFLRVMGIDMHPHQLRHAFAINLLENGANIRSIQKLLGHAKIETTMRYLGISDKYLEQDYTTHFGGSVLSGTVTASK